MKYKRKCIDFLPITKYPVFAERMRDFDEIGKLFDDINGPKINLSEDEKKYYLEINLDGYDDDDIKNNMDINLTENTIEIKYSEKKKNNRNSIINEFSKSFNRIEAFPMEVDLNDYVKEYKNKILKLELNKRNTNTNKKIEID